MPIYQISIHKCSRLLLFFCALILATLFILGCGKESYEDGKIGITIKKIGSDLNDRWSLKGVIVETVKPGSNADNRIRAGELISYIIDERQIDNKKDFRDLIT